MFGSKKTKIEQLLEDKKKAVAELTDLVNQAQKETDAKKKEQLEKDRKLRFETERINRYHLSENPEIRIFSFISWMIQNPTLTYVDGKGLVHRYNLVEELGKDRWNLLDYFQKLTSLVNSDDIL